MSFKRLVSELLRVKVGNFGKVAHAGGLHPWNARVSITREKHYSSTNFAKTKRENTNKKSKVREKCAAYNLIQVFTAMLHLICQGKQEKQH